jgi:hypothetical protein
METMTEIFDSEGGDKGSFFCHVNTTENLAHGYTHVYEKYMEMYRDQEINILEIGICSPFYPGASLRSWYRYLEKASIFGIDIVDCSSFDNDRVKTAVVDQTSSVQLKNFISDIPTCKFIIDDGCHDDKAILISLGSLFPKLESGGIYFIEDLHVVDCTKLLCLKDRTLQSPHITRAECDYINQNVSDVFFTEDGKMCVITKK